MNSQNDNPLPKDVYQYMLRFLPPDSREPQDLHHSLFEKGLVRGMPIEVRRMIHDPMNLLWVPKKSHASHASIPSKQEAYQLLCERFGVEAIEQYVTEMLGKFKYPPFTLESLQGE